MLNMINIRTIQLSNDMSSLTAYICANNEAKLSVELDTTFDKFAFPLKTESEMQKLEDHLLNKEHANKFVSRNIFILFYK